MTIDTLGSLPGGRMDRLTPTGEQATPPAGATRAPAVPVETANPVAAKGAAPTMDELQDAVGKLNASVQASSQSLQFSIDEDSKRTVVKLIDLTTKEVVRQYPTEEALRISKSLDNFKGGLLINHRV